MLIRLLLLCFATSFAFAQNSWQTPFEKGNGNQSATYQEMNAFYQKLDAYSKDFQYLPKGEDDNGKPIYVAVYNPFKEKDFDKLAKDKGILFILNGIHPGEPDGIDATMMLMRDLATHKIKTPKNVVVAAISAYNVSGMLNRGSHSRANQNGPEEYGFRGNARNYDLNRDFIKTDTKNAKSFQRIFHALNPDVFIDNHVSNGSDYQYVFTYISSFKERVGKVLGDYFYRVYQAKNLSEMKELGYDSTPYVNIHGATPNVGFAAFEDKPRYSTGYTSLFNVLSTMPETHMLKPYDQRVWATYNYMVVNIRNLDKHYKKVKQVRKENLKQYLPGRKYGITWKIDSTRYKKMEFKGFAAKYKPSKVSGKSRLYYDRNEPFTKEIKFYDTAVATRSIRIPKYYVVPQYEFWVIDELQRNKIKMKRLKHDTIIQVESYKIQDFKTRPRPYEGHYLHYETVVKASPKSIKFSAGDYLVPTQQPGVKYLLETLEPEAVDSFFNWNFFDSILDQKEYFSAYVFEDTAAKLLQENKALKVAFEAKKAIDPQFAQDGHAQLDWIYRHSPYFESKTYRQYPIYRINN